MEDGRPDLISGLSAAEWNSRFATLHDYLIEAEDEFRCGRASEHEFVSNCRSLIQAIKELRTVLGDPQSMCIVNDSLKELQTISPLSRRCRTHQRKISHPDS